jgi:hypothetical protein
MENPTHSRLFGTLTKGVFDFIHKHIDIYLLKTGLQLSLAILDYATLLMAETSFNGQEIKQRPL